MNLRSKFKLLKFGRETPVQQCLPTPLLEVYLFTLNLEPLPSIVIYAVCHHPLVKPHPSLPCPAPPPSRKERQKQTKNWSEDMFDECYHQVWNSGQFQADYRRETAKQTNNQAVPGLCPKLVPLQSLLDSEVTLSGKVWNHTLVRHYCWLAVVPLALHDHFL